jgi:hypothetical protein
MSASSSMLVSLHMAKTAGTSFAAALRAHYGEGLVEDYGMLPINRPRGRREWDALRAGFAARRGWPAQIRAIHGHFLPVMYRIAFHGRMVDYVTWLRDPVERLVSNYHYWRRQAHGATPEQPLRYRMACEGWSLERFCLGPEFRNLYRQYLWGFEPRRFAFIGITERYEEDLDYFARHFLDGAATATHARANPERDSERYLVDPSLRARIERHHAADMALYRWVRDQDRG